MSVYMQVIYCPNVLNAEQSGGLNKTSIYFIYARNGFLKKDVLLYIQNNLYQTKEVGLSLYLKCSHMGRMLPVNRFWIVSLDNVGLCNSKYKINSSNHISKQASLQGRNITDLGKYIRLKAIS